MTAPRKLSMNPRSPNFNANAIKRVDKVFVDDVLITSCYAYDVDAGWVMQISEKGIWLPKIYGTVTVTEKT